MADGRWQEAIENFLFDLGIGNIYKNQMILSVNPFMSFFSLYS